jgi:hypothetical protein
LQAEGEVPVTIVGTTLKHKGGIGVTLRSVLAAGNAAAATVAGSHVAPRCGTAFVGVRIADGTAADIDIHAICIRFASRWRLGR